LSDQDSTDDEGPIYGDDLDGMNKAYDDIQSIFAEVARDYPEVFFTDDKKIGEGDAPVAGDGAGSPEGRAAEPEQPKAKDTKVRLKISPLRLFYWVTYKIVISVTLQIFLIHIIQI
jgi:hypothetical protein